MTSLTSEVALKETVAAIKGRMVSLTVLEVFGTDFGELERKICEKADQAPKFFRNAPILIDFEHLDEEVSVPWFAKLCKMLVDNHFIPVGVTGSSESLEEVIKARDIAVWPTSQKSRQAIEPEPKEAAEHKPEPEQQKHQQAIETEELEAKETLVIRQPIRSGQKIHARGGDLIVLSSVNTGAEILADGHIHVYGTLRGRALAGVQGMRSARIFCRDLQAELVAIAGYYVINDDLPEEKRNKAAQIYLEEEQIHIESL